MFSLRSTFLAVFVTIVVTGIASQTAILALRGSLSTPAVQVIAGR
jgi:hypothetical protein